MKKIIATVLAMVMALALCTTAMAATTSTSTVNGTTTTLNVSDDYNLRAADSNTVASKVTTSITTTTLSTKTVTTDGKETKTYVPVIYTLDGISYAVCDSNYPGTQRLFKDNAFVANVARYDVPSNDATWLSSATAITKGTDCGGYEADGYKVGSNAYKTVATGDTPAGYAFCDGKLVAYGAANGTKAHDFGADATITYKANSTTPIAIVCKTCKVSYDIVKKSDLGSYSGATLLASESAALVTAIGEENAANYFIKLEKGTATDTKTDGTKPSPKTFDAGIAMYVGMALTSVAGSAVVIGKKKEF